MIEGVGEDSGVNDGTTLVAPSSVPIGRYRDRENRQNNQRSKITNLSIERKTYFMIVLYPTPDLFPYSRSSPELSILFLVTPEASTRALAKRKPSLRSITTITI